MCENLVSVIIPAYNHEKYVQETIRSIIDQTYKNIELIIIDDGSKDSTWQKICDMKEECEKRFVRVDFSTKENEGTCETLNRLLEKVKGDFVYITASDDLAMPYTIEEELEFLINNEDYAMAVGDNQIIDSMSKPCFWKNDAKEVTYNIKEAKYKTHFDYLKKRNHVNENNVGTYASLYINNSITNGFLIRKSIFDIIGKYKKEAPLEDYWMMLQISKYAKIKFINKVYCKYRWHGANSMSQDFTKINKYDELTRRYEENILKNIDFEKCLPEVKIVAEKGSIYKRRGIPFFLEKIYYRKAFDRITIVKILGINILKNVKKDYFI